MNTEISYLQNAANDLNLEIVEKYNQDKRRKVKKYFATRNGWSVSPALDYENLNNFLLGWRSAIRYN